MHRNLAMTYAIVLLGHGLWRATFHVHALTQVGVSDLELSALFSLAAVPGLLALYTGRILHSLNLSTAVALLCALTAIGLFSLPTAQHWIDLIPGVLLISAATAFIYPLAGSRLAHQGNSRIDAMRSLARLRSYGPLSALLASVLIALLLPPLGFDGFIYLLAPLILLLGIGCARGLHGSSNIRPPTRLKLYRQLTPYYLLSFLCGARSALFKLFVITLLVRKHGFDMHYTALLVLAGALSGYLGYRLIGVLSTRVPNRWLLLGAYLVVSLLFIGFAIAEQTWLLALLFLLDSLLFGISVISDGLIKSLAPSNALAGQMGVGVSLFHLAGVLTPLAGGLIAEVVGRDGVFLVAAAIALSSAVMSLELSRRSSAAAIQIV